MARRRIGIVFPWAHLDTVPSLCNAVVLLERAGYEIDLLVHTSSALPRPSFQGKVKVFVLENEEAFSGAYRIVSAQLEGAKSSYMKSLLQPAYRIGRVGVRSLRFMRNRFGSNFWRIRLFGRHVRRRYACLIGVDPVGLVLANRLSPPGVPVGYYSLELLIDSEITTSSDRETKKHEVEASSRAAFVVVQDEERASILIQENQIKADNIILVPNAPLGSARYDPNKYWHIRFSLPQDARVLLHSGSLEDWTAIPEIASHVDDWPEKWVFVIHTRSLGGNAKVLERVEKYKSRRIYLSTDPVPRDEVSMLVRGAHAGLAFYVAVPGHTHTQRNITSIGLSSGKVASYLQAGLPIIVNDTLVLSNLVRNSECGLVADSPAAVAHALSKIDSQYEDYRAKALTAFASYFNFESRFQSVIERVMALDQSRAQIPTL